MYTGNFMCSQLAGTQRISNWLKCWESGLILGCFWNRMIGCWIVMLIIWLMTSWSIRGTSSPLSVCGRNLFITPQPTDQSSLLRKRPPQIPSLVGKNVSYLVPENIHKKFIEGWSSHVPLTLRIELLSSKISHHWKGYLIIRFHYRTGDHNVQSFTRQQRTITYLWWMTPGMSLTI